MTDQDQPEIRAEDFGLTDLEKSTLGALADAWNYWTSLPNRCADDDTDFRQAIHGAQQKLALRVARRADPSIWRQSVTADSRVHGDGD